MAQFRPRNVFHELPALPRTFYLGHHRAGLQKMKTLLSNVDLIVECRDRRVPLTSRNPALERGLQYDQSGRRERLIIYTKSGLVQEDAKEEIALAQMEAPAHVLFSDIYSRKSVSGVLHFMKDHFRGLETLTGSRMMIVGMPNVGKSSLLNALRRIGLDGAKAARTGSQPGITRKIGSGVKVIQDSEDNDGVYLIDTPGVFVPYVESSEAMLKLAICGNVKDSIIGSIIMADYLLYRINLVRPQLYEQYSAPTNNVETLLSGVAQKTGKLSKGARFDLEGAATWLIQQWRAGKLGRFSLDTVPEAGEKSGSSHVIA